MGQSVRTPRPQTPGRASRVGQGMWFLWGAELPPESRHRGLVTRVGGRAACPCTLLLPAGVEASFTDS